MRSWLAIHLNSHCNLQYCTATSPSTSESHWSSIYDWNNSCYKMSLYDWSPQYNYGSHFESIEVVMMSCAGIQESHNFITIQTHGLKAIFEMIATRAYGHQSVNFDTLDLMSSTIWLSYLRFSCGCNSFAASRFDKGLFPELFTGGKFAWTHSNPVSWLTATSLVHCRMFFWCCPPASTIAHRASVSTCLRHSFSWLRHYF